MQHGVTKQLATFVSRMPNMNLPSHVIAKAVACLVDSVGCMLGGTLVPEVRRVVSVGLEGLGVDGPVAVPGLSGRFGVTAAAYAAAQYANALDYDDTVPGVGHPGAVVNTAALMVGQECGSTGMDLIRAVVAGYEVAIRVGRAMAPSQSRARLVRGHSSLIFGGAAAAAVLLRLNAEQVADAFGHAARHATVPFVGKWYDERPLSPLKNNYGWVAVGGIMAARLAAAGIRGNRQVFDGLNGFWKMASSDRWDSLAALRGLGTEFSILSVEFKLFPACRYIHTVLDAVDKLVLAHTLEPGRIVSIRVCVPEFARVFVDFNPSTAIDPQFSIQYMVAAHILKRWVSWTYHDDIEIRELAKRIDVICSNSYGHHGWYYWPAYVELVLDDGRRLSARSAVPPGTPDNPIGDQILDKKFLVLAEPVLGRERARQLRFILRRVADLPNVRILAKAFADEPSLLGKGEPEC
jgi:2-methylcitrate dehydratase PrpD